MKVKKDFYQNKYLDNKQCILNNDNNFNNTLIISINLYYI